MKKLNIPDILPDNDVHYFKALEEHIKSVDSLAEIVIKSSIEGMVIYILPSIPQLRDNLISLIRKFHYNLNINIEFSKSLLISKFITFKVKVW